jgi:predicted metal-dependent peptidase
VDILDPVLPWREILQNFMNNFSKDDYRWTPPNRRHVYKGLYLPSCRSESLDPIVIGIDTSGSIGDKELGAFLAEVSGICRDLSISVVHVVYCHSSIYHVDDYTTEDLPIVAGPVESGGTSFTPVFNWVTEQGIDPACLIYLTDGYGDAPEVAPDYPVLWGLTKQHKLPEWGDHLFLDV